MLTEPFENGPFQSQHESYRSGQASGAIQRRSEIELFRNRIRCT